MRKECWADFKFFHPWEDWGDPELIEYELVFKLEKLRKFIGVPIVILCGTQGKHAQNSLHYFGRAVDCYAKEISVVDFFLAAERFEFGGIGLYRWWEHRGLHLDIRIVPDGMPAARWASPEEGEYIALNEKFLKTLI